MICLIVLASFVTFAVEQTKSASGHQQAQLNSELPGATAGSTQSSSGSKPGTIHRALDETSNELTSPFEGVVAGSNSEWAIRGVKLVLALLVYGFGLGYLARVLRVRV